jgi:Mce-associated membrane protein
MEGDAGTGQLIPAPVEESGEPAVAETVPPARSRLDTRGWFAAVCATLLVLAAMAAVAGVLTLRANRDSRSVARAEAAAMAAAKDCVTATQAPDTTSMLASQQKIIDCATGDFGAQAALYSGVLVDAYQAAKAQVQVSDMRTAVERHNGDGSMDILVALRVKVSNSAVQDQETGYRLRVQMAPDNGTYKIARLDQVTK